LDEAAFAVPSLAGGLGRKIRIFNHLREPRELPGTTPGGLFTANSQERGNPVNFPLFWRHFAGKTAVFCRG
jgi:hypothetical protein